MAGKISDLTELLSVSSGDFLEVVDVSDTTASINGTNKKIAKSNLITGLVASDITGLTSSVDELNILDGATVSASELNILDGATLSTTELNYVDGVTSSIQTQLDSKQSAIGLTASRAVVTNGSGTLDVSATTSTEIGYVSGVTSSIQTQMNTKASTASPTFTGDVGLATGANIQVNGADPKRTFYVPSSAMYPSITQPCSNLTQVETTTNKVNVKVLDFDGAGSAKEYAEFGVQSPSYWDASTVTAQFIWYATAGSGTVNWEIQGGAFSDDDALDAAYGTLQEVTDTVLATGDIHISAETSAITIAGSPVAGDWLQFRIARDPANDTDTSDARLLGVRIRFGMAQYNDA